MHREKKAKVDWTIKAMLSKDIEADRPPLTTAWVASIRLRKDISKVVQFLSKVSPMASQHLFLKRVKTTKDHEEPASVIVAIGGESQPTTANWPSDIGSSWILQKVEMPARSPLTRRQFEAACDWWPCHFHADKRLEAILNQTLPEIWNDLFYDRHCDNMRDALVMFKSGHTTSAGIVFNPKTNSKIVSAKETTNSHPLRHSAMNLIDGVAHVNGGGVWPMCFDESTVIELGNSNSKEAYLLTGCDVYLTHEPCIMCSMALVHSRVGRIFFAEASLQNGGIASTTRLQSIRDLNHTFEVYQMSTTSHE
jgi:tRNA-specific adenosine deaminase 3